MSTPVTVLLTMAMSAIAPSPCLVAQDLAEEIRKLGSDRLEERDKAMNRLIQVGIRAKPLLRKAAKEGSLEVRSRAASALSEIIRLERIRVYEPSPSRISLDLTNVPLDVVLAKVREQTTTSIRVKGRIDKRLVTISLDKAPLFKALDALCRNHGNLVYTLKKLSANFSVFLGSGNRPDPPRKSSGSFLVELESIRILRKTVLPITRKDETRLVFRVYWENGIEPVGARVVVDELTDDVGTRYPVEQLRRDVYVQFARGSGYVSTLMGVSMPSAPPPEATRFSLIRGRQEVFFPDDIEIFTFRAPVGAKEQRQASGIVEVRLLSCVRDQREVKALFEVRPERLSNMIRVRLVLGDGKLRQGSVDWPNTGEKEGAPNLSILFHHIPEEVAITELRCTAVTATRTRTIPFSFRDIRIRKLDK